MSAPTGLRDATPEGTPPRTITTWGPKLEMARTDTIIAAYDRGLASADDRVAMTAADTLLDRYLGRPTAVTESQPPGTQAYVELRSMLASLPPGDRLAYLREARIAAAIAAAPHQRSIPEAERAVNLDPDPAPRELEQGEGAREE